MDGCGLVSRYPLTGKTLILKYKTNMKKQTSMIAVLPVLFGFFVMGFCDIVGISSDYAREAFGWSNTMEIGRAHV